MALFYRVRCDHSGLPGGPALSVFNFGIGDGANPQSVAQLVGDFWAAARNGMGSPWAVNIENEVEIVDEATGDVTATSNVAIAGVTAGGTGFEWSAKQGLLALRTSTYRGGRRVQGRLFIPGVAGETGEQVPTQAYRTIIDNAASGMLDDADSNGTPWGVYSRPTTGTPARAGQLSPIQSTITRSYWAVLRSRRD